MLPWCWSNGRWQSQRQFWDKRCEGQFIGSSKANNDGAVKLVGHEEKHICTGEEPAQLLSREIITHKIYHSPWMEPKIWWTTEI